VNSAELDVRESPEGVTFRVRVQPRASRSAVTGLAAGAVRVSLTSPPVEGAANAACTEFFASLFKVAKSRVSIVSGLKSRDKMVRVAGLDKAAFFASLAKVGV
jgi:TIGR00251 family protein